MNCTAIKLLSKPEFKIRTKSAKENQTPSFVGEEPHSYSFSFRRKSAKLPNSAPESSPAITTINLPSENLTTLNGSSMERWANKQPRLRSAKSSKNATPPEDLNFCYARIADPNLDLFNDEQPQHHSSDGDSMSNIEYQIHTDIEQLIEKTLQNVNAEGEIKTNGKRRRKKKHKELFERDKSSQKDQAKTIKFSISKPPSPQTEQVIRVDVTSSVGAAGLRHEENKVAVDQFGEERCRVSKNHHTNDTRKKTVARNDSFIFEEDIVLRCKKLALMQFKRKRKFV